MRRPFTMAGWYRRGAFLGSYSEGTKFDVWSSER